MDKNNRKLDLEEIISIIEDKDKIENNPFANLPEEALEDALQILNEMDQS